MEFQFGMKQNMRFSFGIGSSASAPQSSGFSVPIGILGEKPLSAAIAKPAVEGVMNWTDQVELTEVE